MKNGGPGAEMNEVEEAIKDLNNWRLPEDEKNINKMNCSPENGERVYWYFQEDVDFQKEYAPDIEIRLDPPYSGIAVAKNGIEIRGAMEMPEDCLIVIDRYPVEKCYCESSWIAMGRLLDAPGLIEVFTKN